MSATRRFMQVDVFSSRPYMGNPVAVVIDGDGIPDDDMQRVARWTNLSETTFICAPTHPDADYRLRIFTPGGELPFAGHPTLGSAHAWLESGGVPQNPERIVQEVTAGLVRVRRGDVLSFAAPPMRKDGPLDEAHVQEIADAFGIERSRILEHQWVDNGPGWSVVRLANAEEVLQLEPDLAKIPNGMVGAIGDYPEGSEFAYEMRTFAPAVGVAEDPVCGSMNASVGQWIASTESGPTSYRVSQGSRIGRAGAIDVSSDSDGTVWVGGGTITGIRGEIVL